MKKGTRIIAPFKRPGAKSGRYYGSVLARLRAITRPFTYKDAGLPDERLLFYLHRSGEVKRLQKATMGRYADHNVWLVDR